MTNRRPARLPADDAVRARLILDADGVTRSDIEALAREATAAGHAGLLRDCRRARMCPQAAFEVVCTIRGF